MYVSALLYINQIHALIHSFGLPELHTLFRLHQFLRLPDMLPVLCPMLMAQQDVMLEATTMSPLSYVMLCALLLRHRSLASC